MMGTMELLLTLVMSMGQGPSELLDLVPTTDYWRIQGVELTTENMQAQLKAEGTDNIRRLMAIRSLGELKSREALPGLIKLAGSKELFVADYAKRAIAAVGGRKWQAKGVPLAVRVKHVNFLPAGTAMVGQFAVSPGGGPVDLAKLIGKMGPMGEQLQREGGIDQMLNPLLQFAGMVGNFRVDSVTMGVSGNVANREGFVVFIARGLYDAKRCAAALKGAMTDGDEQKIEKIAGLDVYRPDDEVAILFVSNEVLAFTGGPSADQLPVEALAKALKAGKGTLRDNKQLAAVIDATDKTGRIWAAAQLTETYRKATPIFEPFHAASLSTNFGKDGTLFTVLAKGADADQVSAAVAQLNDQLTQARKQMDETLGQMPMLKPMAEFLKSIAVKQAKADVTITAKMSGDATAAMMLAPMMMFGARASAPDDQPMVEEDMEVQPAP